MSMMNSLRVNGTIIPQSFYRQQRIPVVQMGYFHPYPLTYLIFCPHYIYHITGSWTPTNTHMLYILCIILELLHPDTM
jgi:hypothetical protein